MSEQLNELQIAVGAHLVMVYSGGHNGDTMGLAHVADQIIALVEQDVARRLLNDDVLFAVHGLDSAEALQAAIAAIGIGEEQGHEHP